MSIDQDQDTKGPLVGTNTEPSVVLEDTYIPEKDISVELYTHALKDACDALIFSEENDNFLFITQYGGTVTQEKYDRDKRTDFDLRLVCFTLPPEAEQDRIRSELKKHVEPMSVELYFHSYEKYVTGEVGETGTVTVLESIKKGLDPEKTVTNLEHPSMVALYTFSTMRFFTHKEEQLSDWLETVVKRQTTYQPEQLSDCTLENIQPSAIVEKISIDKEGIIEWIHLYLKAFLADYYAFKKVGMDDEDAHKHLFDYLRRLSKYLLRIAFGVAVIDTDLALVKEEYVRSIYAGMPADNVHFDMCATYHKNWFNDSVRSVFSAAISIREFSDSFSLEDASVPLLRQSKKEMENQLLFLAQQAGGLLRREKFQDVHDFLTELAITNLIEPTSEPAEADFGAAYKNFAEGEKIIVQGEHSDDIILVPTKKSDGSQNGTYGVRKDGEPLTLKRKKVIVGELAALLARERSTSLVAESDLEALVIDGKRFSELWNKKKFSGKHSEPLLQYFLRSYFDSASVSQEEKDAFLLSFSLLNYFSSEFIQYLYENIDFGSPFSQEKNAEHLLSEYHIPFFVGAIEALLENKNVSYHKETLAENEEARMLFNAGEVTTNMYVVADSGNNGGVELTFTDGTVVVVKKNEIFAEAALLPGNKPVLYSARLLPGTSVYSIEAKDFLDATATTDTLFVQIPESDQQKSYVYKEISAIELYFEVGIQCLDRLKTD